MTKYTTHFVPFPGEQPRTLPLLDRGPRGGHSGNPYRGAVGDEGDPIVLHAFEQHLSIGFELASELITAQKKFNRAIQMGIETYALAARHEVGTRWETMWSQLDDARHLAVRMGRDPSRYDTARQAARDLTSAAADIEIGEWIDAGWRAYKRTIQYRTPDLESAVAAIGALQDAVPSARITQESDTPELRPLRRFPLGRILAAIFVMLAVLFGVYEWRLVHGNPAFSSDVHNSRPLVDASARDDGETE